MSERAKTNSRWQGDRWLRQPRSRRYWLPEKPRNDERAKEFILDVAAPLPVVGAVYLFHYNGSYQEWFVSRVDENKVHFNVPYGMFGESMLISEWVRMLKNVKRLYEPPEAKPTPLDGDYQMTGTTTQRMTSSSLSCRSLAKSTGS
jgi:hypothetical protein